MLRGLAGARRGLTAMLLLLTMAATAAAQTEYRTADEAYRAGTNLLRQRKEAESRAPLEAALKLAPDDAFRVKIYQALFGAYRGLDETEPMLAAADFVLRHAETPTDRTTAARSAISFAFQRGKIDEAIERYEKVLDADADDIAALSVLVYVYSNIRRDKDKAAALTPKRDAWERQAARQRAEKLEQDAALAPRMASALWKDAAVSWLAAGDKDRALAAARKADENGPDGRSELLAHFWHRHLGEVYLETSEPRRAAEHLKAAISLTDIEGYQKDCRDKLAQAEAQLKQK